MGHRILNTGAYTGTYNYPKYWNIGSILSPGAKYPIYWDIKMCPYNLHFTKGVVIGEQTPYNQIREC